MIEGIRSYPDNKVTIFNRNGSLVYEVQGYNNGQVVFTGKNSKGTPLPAGTYFYIIELKDKGQWKYHKGYFVLKY